MSDVDVENFSCDLATMSVKAVAVDDMRPPSAPTFTKNSVSELKTSECKKAVSQVLARISQVTRPSSSNSVTMKTPSKRRRTTDGGAAPDVILTSSGRRGYYSKWRDSELEHESQVIAVRQSREAEDRAFSSSIAGLLRVDGRTGDFDVALDSAGQLYEESPLEENERCKKDIGIGETARLVDQNQIGVVENSDEHDRWLRIYGGGNESIDVIEIEMNEENSDLACTGVIESNYRVVESAMDDVQIETEEYHLTAQDGEEAMDGNLSERENASENDSLIAISNKKGLKNVNTEIKEEGMCTALKGGDAFDMLPRTSYIDTSSTGFFHDAASLGMQGLRGRNKTMSLLPLVYIHGLLRKHMNTPPATTILR
eukprot:gene880-981_t